MRVYVLAPKEREIIEAFLEKDIQLNGYQVLKTRTNRFTPTIILEDLTLIQKFREKANET
jgi:hypothetical protein